MNYKFLFITLGVIIISLSCSRNAGVTENKTETELLPEDIVEMRADQIAMAGIQTGSVEMRLVSNVLKVNGIVTVAPQNKATVCIPMGGFIKNAELMSGCAVSKGQVLAVIENQEFVDIQQNYLEARNKLEYAEAEFKRHTDLFKNDVYSEKNVEQVTVEYKNLRALVKSLEQKLMLIGIRAENLSEENISNNVKLTAPISGFLTSVNINVGKYVSPGDVLFEIVNSNDLLLQLTLFEKDADKAVAGQNIKFFINNEDEVHEAILIQTGKSVSDEQTVTAYGKVISKCVNILPGMYVNAVIEESDRKVTSLPSDAVVSFNDKNYIFISERQKEEGGKPFTEYRMIEIRKGNSSSGFTEIILPEGFDISSSKIVIKGAYNLLSAMKNAGEMAC